MWKTPQEHLFCSGHSFKNFTHINLFNSPNKVAVVLILQKWQLRPREADHFVQGHTGSEPSGQLTPDSMPSPAGMMPPPHESQLTVSKEPCKYSQCPHSTDRRIKVLRGYGLGFALCPKMQHPHSEYMHVPQISRTGRGKLTLI